MPNQETALVAKKQAPVQVIEYIPETERAQNILSTIMSFQHTVKTQFVRGEDYGKAFYGAKKDTLLKSGAEKILMLMGVSSEFEILHQIEDYEKGLFVYKFRCVLKDKNARIITEGFGSCNSKEKQFTSEKVDIFKSANTILKIGRKRAMVDATLTIASLSNIFTQDLEDNSNDTPELSLNEQIKIFLYELITNVNLHQDYKAELINSSDIRNDAVCFITNINRKSWKEIDPIKLKAIAGMIHKNDRMLLDKLNKHFDDMKIRQNSSDKKKETSAKKNNGKDKKKHQNLI